MSFLFSLCPFNIPLCYFSVTLLFDSSYYYSNAVVLSNWKLLHFCFLFTWKWPRFKYFSTSISSQFLRVWSFVRPCVRQIHLSIRICRFSSSIRSIAYTWIIIFNRSDCSLILITHIYIFCVYMCMSIFFPNGPIWNREN